ncbi:DUF1641 domain-containing protein [Lentibacillus sediminis]|uniref:DUF1641 domain-containing protein n=1 Tax=Lentibacillus sediminis TaxID=1940529 RepID=UPI000C1C762D|nr:DUF1641 domain-containing protein [Lentibacillus sediminis]
MAKATKLIHRMELSKEEQRKRDWEEIETALLQNKQALTEAIELLQHLEKKKFLEAGNAALAESQQVLDIVVKFVDNTDTTQSIKNALLVFDTLGKMNMEELEPLILKINTAISQVAKYEHYERERGGYPHLLRALRDPEVVEGLNVLTAFLKGLGVNQEDREKASEESKEQHAREEQESENRDGSKSSSFRGKWYLAAAGASLAALPFLLVKRKVR